jgi:putative tryptophan/tyrosine transport system substrate-binding protein
MNTKLIICLVAAALLSNASFAEAQQPGKIFRIGFLDASNASGMAVLVDAFRQELTKLGWIEGKNIVIEYRYAEGNQRRLPELAAELAILKVDVIVASGAAGLAAKMLPKPSPLSSLQFKIRLRAGSWTVN